MDIGISKQASVSELQDRLDAHLTGLLVVPDIEVLADLHLTPDVLMWLVENPSEFPTGLGVSVRIIEGVNIQHWLVELARVLSVDFTCRTICDGTGFGDYDSPYWSIIWDNGTAYLADDVDSAYGDGDGGPVRVIRPLTELPLDVEPGALNRAVCRGSY